MTDPTEHDLLTEEAMSLYVGIPRATLRQYRYLRTGPPYVHIGRHVRYPRSAVDQWIAERTVTPKAATG